MCILCGLVSVNPLPLNLELSEGFADPTKLPKLSLSTYDCKIVLKSNIPTPLLFGETFKVAILSVYVILPVCVKKTSAIYFKLNLEVTKGKSSTVNIILEYAGTSLYFGFCFMFILLYLFYSLNLRQTLIVFL